MIQLISFIVLGTALLALLYFYAQRTSPKAEGGAQALLEARHAVASLRTDLLPVGLVERIFSDVDLNYVMSKSGKSVQELFHRERKKMALCWVRELRQQALNLKEFHSGQSRQYARLDLRAELALAVNFISLLALCRVLQVLFYLRGASGARLILGPAMSAAIKVCAVSEESLAFLVPSERSGFGNSAEDRAAV